MIKIYSAKQIYQQVNLLEQRIIINKFGPIELSLPGSLAFNISTLLWLDSEIILKFSM